MIIKHIRVSGLAGRREAFLDLQRLWSAGMAVQPGFLGVDVALDPSDQDTAWVLARFESGDALQRFMETAHDAVAMAADMTGVYGSLDVRILDVVDSLPPTGPRGAPQLAHSPGRIATDDPLVEALLGLADAPDRARAAIEGLAGADALAAAIARTLAGRERTGGVYVNPEGFRRFISGGGNRPLYVATSAALAARYPAGAFRLLDIGTGDGRAAIPAVEPHPAPVAVDAVEPSGELRATLAAATAGSRHPWRLHDQPVERFLDAHAGPWDVAQSTFALHNLGTEALRATLRRLRERVRELIVVEFDVPPFASQRDPARVAYCVERYRSGIAEYPDAPVVVDGFLVPVLLGGLDVSTPQTTFERPAAQWAEELAAAGFSHVDVQPVYDYWWAPAVALTAS
jgi:quinol monooxygenase YgiN